ncbi:MAG: type II toxin-antitoxin system VapC family toxin [Methanophagales archaeon]|nr:type II toxin-antitoxin system VapC family toxin [Methanophagales archaeon]
MILRFTDKLPKALYLDSSVILNATMTGGRFHDECASFLRRIRDEGIRCATASLSLDEIWYILIKNKVEHLTGQFLVKSYKSNPNSILSARDDVERITFDLLMMGLEILTVDLDAMLDAKDFLWDCKLLPRDSVHLAVTLKHRFKAIATTNPDFMNTSDLVDVYTCNPKMLR